MSGDILLFLYTFLHFFSILFAYVKKKQYLCTAFGKWPILEGWVSG